MTQKPKQFTARIHTATTPAQKREVAKAAKRDGCSEGDIIRRALDAYLKPKPTT